MRLPQSGFWSAFSRVLILTILFTLPLLTVPAGAQQLTAVPSDLHFGKVIIGQTKILNITLTNSGSSAVTVKSVTNAPAFTVSSSSLPLKIAAGHSAQIPITFAPSSLGQTVTAVALASNASNNPLNIPVRGAGVAQWSLTASPATLAFGSVRTGVTSTLPVVLTNSGASTITISQDEAKGPGFSFTGLTLPLSLAPGHSFTFSATFTPQSTGPVSGAVWISNPKNTVVKILLTGTGKAAGQLTLTPTSINFGNVVDGTSAAQTGTLTASGASVTISSASSSNSEFSLSGLSFPLKLAAGQSVSFTATFAPQTTGSASANLAFSSNATSAATATLAGSGIPPYSVSLSWDASTSEVAGYNVYRGGKTGGPYTKVFTMDLNTSYTDGTVASGNTYYYVTTAVSSAGQESGYSNQVKAVIP
ncbi:MAG: choice-of-anchor D domain-containing protein [Terriglobales bacterium]